MTFFLWAAAGLLWVVGDGLVTAYGLARFNVEESNKAARWLVDRSGFGGFFAAKLGAFAIFSALVPLSPNPQSILAIAVWIGAALVLNNLIAMYRESGRGSSARPA